MLSQETYQAAVKLTFRGTAITAYAITKLIQAYLKKTNEQQYGEQTIKNLNKQGRALESIPVTQEDIKGMKRELGKYGVDFAAMKNPTEKGFDIYFKGQDIKQIQAALKNYVANNFQRKSVIEAVKQAIQKAQQLNQGNKERQKQPERGNVER